VGLAADRQDAGAREGKQHIWELEHVAGKYVIPGTLLTEDEWIKQTGATVIEGDDNITTHEKLCSWRFTGDERNHPILSNWLKRATSLLGRVFLLSGDGKGN
jgi:hypothetical protein